MEAYICITNTGTTPLTGFTIFSNVDNYQTPIISNVPISNFIPPQCPYILSGVPENATILRLFCFTGETEGCCIDIPYSDGFNICDICIPLGFSDNSSPSVGAISVGHLTGGCDPNISNYYLTWFGPGTGSTQQVFTSGLGTGYGVYSIDHPLTGTTSVYLTAGQYRPVIYYIETNGIIYSLSFGAYGDCFQNNPYVILPYTATNGTGVDYEHELVFSAETRPPFTQSGTIELSGTTNYVPFRFDGNLAKKVLRIEFSGSAYPAPLQLENVLLGFEPNSNTLTFNSNQFAKDGGPNADFFTRVLCLTGLTRNAGDTLTFYIDSPFASAENFISNWSFYFDQLPTFDCTSCLLDTPKYLISGGSFSASSGTCSSTTVTFSVSGCSSTVDLNKDLYKYIFKNSGFAYPGPYGYSANANGLIPVSVNLGNGVSKDCTYDVYYSTPNQNPNDCMLMSLSAGTTALLKMYVNVENPTSTTKKIEWWWNDFPTNPVSSALWSYLQNQWSIIDGAFQSNLYTPSDYRYYNALTITIPTQGIGSPVNQCTDEPTQTYLLNKNLTTVQFTTTPSTLFSGQLIYRMTVTGGIFSTAQQQQLLNGYTACDSNNCKLSGVSEHFTQIINKVNTSVISPGNNITGPGYGQAGFPGASVGPTYYTRYPFNVIFATQTNSQSNPQGATANTSNFASVYQYQMKTYPSSGASPNSQTVISGLTADTCSSLTGKTYNPYSADSTNYRSVYQKYHFYYDIVDNPSVPLGYSIYANDILANGQVSGTQTLIATGTGSTITVLNSSYFT